MAITGIISTKKIKIALYKVTSIKLKSNFPNAYETIVSTLKYQSILYLTFNEVMIKYESDCMNNKPNINAIIEEYSQFIITKYGNA